MPVFDSRAFTIPKEDVVNAFLWRAKDWERNSLQMYCRSFFSHKQLHKKKKEDTDRMNMIGINASMRPMREMVKAFEDVPEAVENTVKIAERCNVEIELGNIQLPFFSVPKGCNENTYLKKLCEKGLVERYKKNYNQVSTEIRERLDYELSVIEKMGWPSYFLIVADFVNWAKKSNIIVGPGRGSAAGSLVCYLTGITNIDPLKYDLLFERFSPDERERIDAFFSRMGRAIMKNDIYWIENNIGGGINNHLAWHKMMLGLLGIFYGQDELVDYAL